MRAKPTKVTSKGCPFDRYATALPGILSSGGALEGESATKKTLGRRSAIGWGSPAFSEMSGAVPSPPSRIPARTRGPWRKATRPGSSGMAQVRSPMGSRTSRVSPSFHSRSMRSHEPGRASAIRAAGRSSPATRTSGAAAIQPGMRREIANRAGAGVLTVSLVRSSSGNAVSWMISTPRARQESLDGMKRFTRTPPSSSKKIESPSFAKLSAPVPVQHQRLVPAVPKTLLCPGAMGT